MELWLGQKRCGRSTEIRGPSGHARPPLESVSFGHGVNSSWTFATGNLTASQYLSSFLAIMPILKKFTVSTQKYRKDIKILICFESEGKPRDYGTLSGL